MEWFVAKTVDILAQQCSRFGRSNGKPIWCGSVYRTCSEGWFLLRCLFRQDVGVRDKNDG